MKVYSQSMTMNLILKLRNFEMKTDPTLEYIHAICCWNYDENDGVRILRTKVALDNSFHFISVFCYLFSNRLQLSQFTIAMFLFLTIQNVTLTNIIHSLKLSQWRSIYNLHKIVRFEVFTAVTMKSGVFWDVTPCGSCKNRRFGST
jgi:hypothetical protein